MPDIFYLVRKWWKQLLLIIVLAVVVVAAVTFLQPTRYLSVATALPANPALTDKGSIFNTNIQGLYPSMGGPDELDAIVGTASLDTVYLAVANEFNIWDHYKPEVKKEEQLYRSAAILKKNTRVIKSDFGELKVKVWDTDPNLAPQLANSIMNQLNVIHQAVINESNGEVLDNLKKAREKIISAIDSLPAPGLSIRTQVLISKEAILIEQLKKYETLIGEYQLVFDSKPSALVVIERARAAKHPDHPDRLMILAATAFLALLFGLLLALVMEKRKMKTV